MNQSSHRRELTRRSFLSTGAAGAGALAVAGTSLATADASPQMLDEPDPEQRLRLSVKYGMVGTKGSVADRFALLKSLGYDGVEMDSPSNIDINEVQAASRTTGLPVHGVVNSIHWQVRLSDPDPAVRAKAIDGMRTAIRDSHAMGGSSVLLVPGRVANAETENHEQVWARSIEGIHAVLPLAALYGIHILIENVWNGFLYRHDGPNDQSADLFAQYIDDINSPWVGAYFDLGNHRKYGVVEEWVRTLGRRIVKLDVKDWGVANGWAKIGDGDVNWPAVRAALVEIGFTGWCTAEVGGGDEARLADIHRRMNATLRGK